MSLSYSDRLKLSSIAVPSSCLLAVWLWRNPWKVIFVIEKDGRPSNFFYHPLDKAFYYRRPENAVRNDWLPARGMDQHLAYAMKYFKDVLCISDQEVTCHE